MAWAIWVFPAERLGSRPGVLTWKVPEKTPWAGPAGAKQTRGWKGFPDAPTGSDPEPKGPVPCSVSF